MVRGFCACLKQQNRETYKRAVPLSLATVITDHRVVRPAVLCPPVAAALLGLLLSCPALGQTAQTAGQIRTWRFTAAVGLTELDRDADAPGTMTLLGVERRFGERMALGLELGFGSTDTVGECNVGSVIRFECEVTEFWSSYGAGAAARLFRAEQFGMSARLLGQVGWHGPDANRFYDVGFSFGFDTVGPLEIGVEWRRRLGDDAGMLWLFRAARRWDSGAAG